jgi:hypothetical protein
MTVPLVSQGVAPQPSGVLLGNVAYIPPGLEKYYKEPFSYNVVFNNIGPAAVQAGTTNIQNDSYFVCTQQMAEIFDVATLAVNVQPNVANMSVRILDTSSGKFNMDQPTPLASQFGTASQPKVWLYRAKLYQPGGQIQVELTNGMAAAQRVRLTFEGFKVYRVPDALASM